MTPTPITPENTRRFLVIMWSALFVTIGMYYYLTTILPAGKVDANSPLALPLLGFGIASVLASLYFKARFGARNDRPRTLAMVRAGYVVALVFDEIPALLGFVVYMLSAWPWHWVFYVISAAGLAINFPQRGDFEQAGGNN
jgi:hypothetical protein